MNCTKLVRNRLYSTSFKRVLPDEIKQKEFRLYKDEARLGTRGCSAEWFAERSRLYKCETCKRDCCLLIHKSEQKGFRLYTYEAQNGYYKYETRPGEIRRAIDLFHFHYLTQHEDTNFIQKHFVG